MNFLPNNFEMKDLGDASFAIGIEIHRLLPGKLKYTNQFGVMYVENERLAKRYTESLNKMADQLKCRTSCQSLKEELKRVNDEYASKESEHMNAMESLKQDHAAKVTDLESQIRDFLIQKAAAEAIIKQLHQDLAAHRNHIEALASRLQRVHSDVHSRYHYEIQDLKDCLMIEQEEKNELNKKLQILEKELLIGKTKLVEHQQDLTSNRHVESLKQKVMKLRKENEEKEERGGWAKRLAGVAEKEEKRLGGTAAVGRGSEAMRE
ncbi:hypothetical protein RJ639_037109 [Escallonia herrerae]|uniref:Uncharacterized protein n=1 Tax=Escallonia herrerae TaxID=1293975 RepID=A0AA89B9I2_9ASTE|nr:hypothetical protein RJ639_037109 [Escallonia herrerae]